MYDIQFAKGAEDDLKQLAAFHRNTILDAIERTLASEPTQPSRNRKVMVGLMKRATVQDLQKRANEFVTKAQRDQVVITRQGKPAAVLVGVNKQDWESVVLQTDPKFWKLIRARRKQATRSLAEVRARLHRRK